MAMTSEQALDALREYFDHGTGNVPQIMLVLEPLLEAGQACVDWARDTGECHLCDYDGLARKEHDDECPLRRIHSLPPLEPTIAGTDLLVRAARIIEITGQAGDTSVTRGIAIELAARLRQLCKCPGLADGSTSFCEVHLCGVASAEKSQ